MAASFKGFKNKIEHFFGYNEKYSSRWIIKTIQLEQTFESFMNDMCSCKLCPLLSKKGTKMLPRDARSRVAVYCRIYAFNAYVFSGGQLVSFYWAAGLKRTTNEAPNNHHNFWKYLTRQISDDTVCYNATLLHKHRMVWTFKIDFAGNYWWKSVCSLLFGEFLKLLNDLIVK